MPSEQDIAAALSDLPTPNGRALGESGLLGGIVVREDRVFVSLEAKEVEPTAMETLARHSRVAPEDPAWCRRGFCHRDGREVRRQIRAAPLCVRLSLSWACP